MKFTGRIISGLGEAKKFGFPTINLSLHSVPERLRYGVYSAKVTLKSHNYIGIAYFGPRFGHKDRTVFEVHCFVRTPCVLGKKVTIELGPRIRGVKIFKHMVALKKQIQKDIKRAKKLL